MRRSPRADRLGVRSDCGRVLRARDARPLAPPLGPADEQPREAVRVLRALAEWSAELDQPVDRRCLGQCAGMSPEGWSPSAGVTLGPIRDSTSPANGLVFVSGVAPGYAPPE